METDYYKSLDPDYVCGKLLRKGKVVEVEDVIDDEEDVGSDEERDEKLEDPTNINDGDAAFSNHQRTASVMRSSNSISEPPAKKQLFPPKRELQTPKSEIQTSMPSNIAELYSAMALLIKESEERMTVFCRAEFISIREEMTALHNKVGDKPVVVTTEQHIHPSSNIGSSEKSPSEGTGQSIHSEVAKSEMLDVLADTGVNAKLDESDLPTEIVDAKLDDTDVLAEGSGEASALDPDAGVAKTALNTEMDASDVSNAVAQVSAEYMLFNPSEMDEINNSVLLATQQHVPQSKVQLKNAWSIEMERIQIERDVEEVVRATMETENEVIHGRPKGRKKILPAPQVLEVWDKYPEFLPLDFEPEEHFLPFVRGDDSLYNQPWWTMESAGLVPEEGDRIAQMDGPLNSRTFNDISAQRSEVGLRAVATRKRQRRDAAARAAEEDTEAAEEDPGAVPAGDHRPDWVSEILQGQTALETRQTALETRQTTLEQGIADLTKAIRDSFWSATERHGGAGLSSGPSSGHAG
ncbi:hypothetical protein LWI29_017069 [Acer saccharum]|uniref:Uncharacterized protein n=1 Tax=Acer saccharum TaxID=4024 RepID=A0AA39STB4_ACESA|nr:hypothetical protein LWI29_017069 [Acer saccharum]